MLICKQLINLRIFNYKDAIFNQPKLWMPFRICFCLNKLKTMKTTLYCFQWKTLAFIYGWFQQLHISGCRFEQKNDGCVKYLLPVNSTIHIGSASSKQITHKWDSVTERFAKHKITQRCIYQIGIIKDKLFND